MSAATKVLLVTVMTATILAGFGPVLGLALMTLVVLDDPIKWMAAR